MNIAVLIKQVPGTTDVKINPETGNIIRDGVASKLNPYDLFALEMALSLKPASITVITMGPNQAKSVILEAVYMGCDLGYVVSDRRFAGADVLATSRTLAGAIKKTAELQGLSGYDLIICGKQTTDGDTAQVGPETAECLDIPHVSDVLSIDVISGEHITLTANMGDYEQKLCIPLPVLITIDKDVNTPRLPSIKRKYMLAESTDSSELARFISLDDFDNQDASLYGQSGSPTHVEKIFQPEANSDKQVFTGSGEELSERLLNCLRDMKVI